MVAPPPRAIDREARNKVELGWIVFLLAVFIYLGLRDRTHRGSTHLTVLVVVGLTLGLLFVRLGR
jgi:hypothetical protein